jgi:hypothetical protein
MTHILSVDQKNERVLYAKLLLTALIEHNPIDFERIITGDESWFFLYYPRDPARELSRDDHPHRIKSTIDVKQRLISTLWSVKGIHGLLDVLKGMAYNIMFFTDVVMPSLIQNIISRNHRKMLKRWVIHIDNARPHNSRLSQECIRASKAERLPHPAYKPNLAPSAFFLW